MNNDAVRLRFAPSPTGHLHLGGVRCALFNFLYARSTGGSYLIRIEDTDEQRSSQEYLESLLGSLSWLSLKPDEPIVYQSNRKKVYEQIVNRLVAEGKTYRCYCEPRDLAAVEQAREEVSNGNRYDGSCREREPQDTDKDLPYAVRFKIPSEKKELSFTDMIRGVITIDVGMLDDFVIMRRDGTCTYNFCVVVDDDFMNITHVFRGEDHISNTPKQLLVYECLGLTPPFFAHLPLILGPSGGKLSKRDLETNVDHYRKVGILPQALINYLVRLGWSHGDQEIFSLDELIGFFTINQINKAGAMFDLKKLDWMNAVYLKEMNSSKILGLIEDVNKDLAKIINKWPIKHKLIDLYKERCTNLVELAQEVARLGDDPDVIDLIKKEKEIIEPAHLMLNDFAHQLSSLHNFDHGAIFSLAKETSEKYQQKLSVLAKPLRLALTGSVKGPGVFDLLSALGKEISMKRMNNFLEHL